MNILTTPYDSLQSIASFIKTTRLNQNVTMENLAIRSGIGIATLARIEKKGVCSTEILVKVLAALGKLDMFVAFFAPEEMLSISDLRAMHRKKPKQRARKSV